MELDKAPRPWLGAHLRYGDSCGARGKRTGRVCAAAEDYARVAHDMILQYGYRSVVVATDTDAALDAFSDELKRLAPAVKVYARHDARVDPKIYKKVKRMEKLFVTEDGRSIAAEMATYEDAVRSVCIPTYVYHDVEERDLPSIRSRAYSGYGYIKEANGGQGECWKSIHRTSHIDRPGLHEAESNDTMARDTSWRVSCVLFVFATSAA